MLLSCQDSNNPVLFQIKKNSNIGIDFVHNNGQSQNYKYPENMSAGIAVLDYDLDGDLDLYFVQSGNGGHSDQIYKSLYNETGILKFTNVTSSLGVNQASFGMGVSIGDYNNDGYSDILISNVKQNVLLENKFGQHFEEVLKIESAPKLSIISAFIDINQNGWLDLVTINNIEYNPEYEPICKQLMGPDYCGPDSFQYARNSIYQNIQGKYQKVENRQSRFNTKYPSLAITIFDVNNDGLSDIYVANDNKENTLWENEEKFKFSESGIYAGIAVNSMAKTEASMGVAIGDINSDGLLDLYLTHMWQETNTLYIQNSVGQFSDVTNQYKLGKPSYQHTGFGTAFLDFENDGDSDIVVANGGMMKNKDSNYNEVNSFYENTGNQFKPLENNKILSSNPKFSSRGLVRADLDNDGDSDIIISNNNAAPEIYINQSNNSNNWIGYTALNESGRMLENVESIAEYNNKTIHNIQTRSGSYASSSDPRVLMGLGKYDSSIVVTIRWNKNEFEQFSNLKPNQYHKLIKGQGLSVLSWPDIPALEKTQPSEKKDKFERAIKQLLESSISKNTEAHINELFSKKENIELCYSLQSYEFINETSFCYEKFFSKNKQIEPDIFYLAALNEVNKFNYKLAHNYFDEAIKLNSESWLYCIRKTQAYILDNDYEQSEVSLSQCKKLKEDIYNDKLSGDIHLAKKQYKQAFKMYRNVLAKQPEVNNLYYQLAESLKHFQSEKMVNLALSKAGKRKLLLTDGILNKLVILNKDPEFHYEKALLANINHDFISAVNAMRRAYELDSENEKIFRNYALLLEKQKQSTLALKVFFEQEKYFSEAESFLAYGLLLSKSKQYVRAQEIYNSGLELFPKHINLLTNLANNYLRLSQLNKAEESYNEVLKIDPNNNNAIAGLKLIKQQ